MLSWGNLEVWCRSSAPWNQHPTGQTSTGLVSQGAGWRLGASPHRFWDMHPAHGVMDASAVQEVCGLLGYEEFCHHQSNSTGQVLTWGAVRQGGSSYLRQVEHKSLTVVQTCPPFASFSTRRLILLALLPHHPNQGKVWALGGHTTQSIVCVCYVAAVTWAARLLSDAVQIRCLQ